MEIVGLVSFALSGIGLVVAMRWRHRKVLRFAYSVDDELYLDVGVAEPNDLRMGGALIEAAIHRVRIRFCNGGNREIRREDMDVPLSISLAAESRIMDCKVRDRVPRSLDVVVSDENGKLMIRVGSMNPKETFSIGVLVRGFDGEVNVDGRILGAKLTRYPTGQTIKSNMVVLCFVAMIVGMISALGFDWFPGNLISILCVMCTLIFLAVSNAAYEELARSVLGLPDV